MKSVFLVYIALALLSTGLFAQKDKAPPTEVSIYAFERNKQHQTIFLESPKNEPYEITLSKANILGPFKTVKDENGKVTIRKKAKDAEGAIIYPQLSKVTIPTHVKEPLLILIPISGNRAYKTYVIDRSLSSFPKASYKIFNLSPSLIRGIVGKTRVTVAPRKLFAFNPSSNVEDIMDVHFQYKNAEKWKTFGRTRWVKMQEKRTLLCVYLDSKTKRMRIRGVNMESIQPLRDRKKTTETPEQAIAQPVENQ
jgi:hypothetical protein|tara:strand:+ start:8525 stop:9280 length:756 start_codon:yes stop_codon:yes gene_type:complete